MFFVSKGPKPKGKKKLEAPRKISTNSISQQVQPKEIRRKIKIPYLIVFFIYPLGHSDGSLLLVLV